MEQPKTALYLPVLTGVRFLAALMIFCYHYGTKTLSSAINEFSLSNIIFGEFYIGVGMFFVLSGFVITYNYYDRNIFKKGRLAKYILRRIVRIFPLYLLLLILYYGYYFYRGIYFTPEGYILNFSLLKGYSNTYWDSGITQAWSLTTEENFYLFAPLIFYFIKKNVKFYKQILFFFLSGFLLFLFFKFIPFWGLFGDFRILIFNTFFGRCFEFFVGVIVAVYFKKNAQFLLNKYSKGTFFFKKFTYIGIFLILFCILLQILIKMNFDHQLYTGILVNNFLVPIAVGCFLFGLIVEKTIISIFFENKIIIILGYSSFAFYLLHIGIIANYFASIFSHNSIVLLIFLQILSVLVFYGIEKPVKIYLTKCLNL